MELAVLKHYLARFDNWAEYCGWDKEDQLFHLKQSLVGPARNILWNEKSKRAEVGQTKDQLKCRFGHQNQEERFIVELQSRRRKPGESLQSLYDDGVLSFVE